VPRHYSGGSEDPPCNPRRRLPLLLAALLLPAAALLSGQRQHGPPYTPAESLATFRLADGFQIELFAAEPLVSDPVAMEVDENGRMYVVEMHGYPLDLSGSGRVVLLTDSDGDGKPDRSTVFADGLKLPTGIMRWKNGVLVTDSPDVWYLEDQNGDGRADVKRVVLTGFALSNPQHTTNTPIYGLDNWIYLANEGPVRTIRYRELLGDEGKEVHFPDRVAGPHLPPDGDGRNVRFKLDTFELETLAARSQFGQTFDAWGHQFLNTNNRHIYQEVIAARYVARNRSLTVPSVVEQLPDYRVPAELFPVTENPEYQLLTDVGVMTAASGVTYYLGDLFPPAYRSAVFVGESAHNLVHVDTVRDNGVTFRASRMFDGREFLASTDSWCRPVNFYIGPDGALYLIDYYRKIIEHPEWLDDATAKSSDLYAGRDLGRIYRIVPTGTSAPSWLNRVHLGTASIDELVRTLAHPNIWWRRHAQRLLVDRQPRGAVARLARLAVSGDSPVGRVHALWTLEGLGKLQAETIDRALGDATPGVRENAIKLAERHLRSAPVRDRLLHMADEADPKVRFQLLLTLGDVDTPAAETIRNRLLLENVEDGWMQVAALSAPKWDAAALFRIAIERLADQDTPGRRTLFNRVAAMAGTNDIPATREIIRRVTTATEPPADWWRAAALQGLASGIRGKKERESTFDAERTALTSLVLRGESTAVRRAALQLLEALGPTAGSADAGLMKDAERLAIDPGADRDARADAIHLLALRDRAAYEQTFRELLGRAESSPVQTAAVRALAELKDPRIAGDFIKWWDGWTPAVREEAVRALVRDRERVRVLLDAVAGGKIRATEINRPLRIRLMMLDDDDLRNRARALFSAPAGSPKEAVGRYQAAAMSLHGDADRGRQVFGRVCSICHQYRGSSGTQFGPDLGEVRSHAPMSLLVDVLDPNHSIADGYELWIVTLTDGSTLAGVMGHEAPTAVTLRVAGGIETVVPRTQIQSMRISDASAMPEGLEAQIDLQQMADLIAFLKSAK
jgi:putative membrane-bound dehydrogenase-like protein